MAVLAASLAIAAPASAAPGNNGTVKIDGNPFSDLRNNEPHVGCEFEVEFFGFDPGDLKAYVTFELQAPSGSDALLIDHEVDLGDGNASQLYTLDFGDLVAHPQQGYHVKLTIHAEGSKGADVKHKVFWVTDCDPCDDDDPQEPPTEV
jgi:hypothetical protein